MPISLSAKKSLRKTLKNRKVNVSFKNKLKDIIKKFVSKPNEEGLKEVYSVLDKATKNHIYQKNKVSRLKAKYTRTLKNGAPVETKKAAKKTVKKAVKKTVKKASKKM